MGYKTLKKRYRIKHGVCVTDEGICIGSPYIHDIIVIGLDGQVLKRYDDNRCNEELSRYQAEFDADPAKLREIVLAADKFTRFIPVYTYDGGEIVEEKCEKPGWPNVTHSGKLMYDNIFSPDRDTVVRWAKNSARLAVKYAKERIEQIESDLAEIKDRLKEYNADLRKLNKDYPGIKEAKE